MLGIEDSVYSPFPLFAGPSFQRIIVLTPPSPTRTRMGYNTAPKNNTSVAWRALLCWVAACLRLLCHGFCVTESYSRPCHSRSGPCVVSFSSGWRRTKDLFKLLTALTASPSTSPLDLAHSPCTHIDGRCFLFYILKLG